jgi:hypothetical protein
LSKSQSPSASISISPSVSPSRSPSAPPPSIPCDRYIYSIGVEGNVDYDWSWETLSPCTIRWHCDPHSCYNIGALRRIKAAGHTILVVMSQTSFEAEYDKDFTSDEFIEFVGHTHIELDKVLHQIIGVADAIEGWSGPNIIEDTTYMSPSNFHYLQSDWNDLCIQHGMPFFGGAIISTSEDAGTNYLAAAFTDQDPHANVISFIPSTEHLSQIRPLVEIFISAAIALGFPPNFAIPEVSSITGSDIPVSDEIDAALYLPDNTLLVSKYCLRSPDEESDYGLFDNVGLEKSAFSEFNSVVSDDDINKLVTICGQVAYEELTYYSPIPVRFIRDFLSYYWRDWGGLLPLPLFMAADDYMGETWRFDEKKSDVVIIRQNRTQDRRIGDDLEYKTSETVINIELFTYNSRQKLYNMMSEVRRILFFGRKRAVIGDTIYIPNDWHLMEYQGFVENSQAQYNNWQGVGRVRLITYGMRTP